MCDGKLVPSQIDDEHDANDEQGGRALDHIARFVRKHMAQQTEAGNPAAGYLRLAIVHDHDVISRLGTRLAGFEKSL